jgi:hypothetical protein
MADSKISALPASTTPLAGTEVLPIVQSSATKQVSVANLTAGRAISATQLTLTTGNLIVANGQGVDFSATSSGSGTMTSELLADYEEGTFTPVVIGSTTAGTASYDFRIARYTKTGRMVQIEIAMQWNSGTGTGNLQISGLPFTNAANYTSLAIGRIDGLALSALNIVTAYVEASATLINFRQYATGGGADSAVAYDAAALIFIAGCYSV